MVMGCGTQNMNASNELQGTEALSLCKVNVTDELIEKVKDTTGQLHGSNGSMKEYLNDILKVISVDRQFDTDLSIQDVRNYEDLVAKLSPHFEIITDHTQVKVGDLTVESRIFLDKPDMSYVQFGYVMSLGDKISGYSYPRTDYNGKEQIVSLEGIYSTTVYYYIDALNQFKVWLDDMYSGSVTFFYSTDYLGEKTSDDFVGKVDNHNFAIRAKSDCAKKATGFPGKKLPSGKTPVSEAM